ncbi:hypothetical protein FC770_11565 [Nocardioides jishulii]|uniref:Core-binding (CB) domain-containing protein n=1 Tax=Nocardioides jishulii TaxID=2575440 RepID=A0A4U2YJX6_9ACTN|nr:hypothetical protein FCL41_04930 [Nocardioides jishulii]TKI61429.1 hypothetical protein FC770_11565 [Nocardioides jishulii]
MMASTRLRRGSTPQKPGATAGPLHESVSGELTHSTACGRAESRLGLASLAKELGALAVGGLSQAIRRTERSMSDSTVFPFQPITMTTAQVAAVSYLARYSGRTHRLYAYQLRRWFTWCANNGLDPLLGIQRAHVELYIHQLGETGLMDSSIVTMMHGVRGVFRFARIDGLIAADPAVYARLPKIQHDESRTQGLDRLELIRFLQVAQTLAVHHARGARVPSGHQRPARIRSSRSAHRGLRRHAARSPSPAPGRQRQQARHHADHDPSATCPGSLPRTAIRRAARSETDHREADRPPRCLPDGCEDRQGRGHPSPHQPALTASRRHHQRPRRRRPAPRCADLGAPRRSTHHRALRPRPRKPRPTRRPLPHRVRRWSVNVLRPARPEGYAPLSEGDKALLLTRRDVSSFPSAIQAIRLQDAI